MSTQPEAASGVKQCVVLAGGLGTRLQTLLPEIPKTLAPVAGKPFLEHLLDWIARQGVSQAVLCTGYRGEQISRALGDGSQLGLRIRYSREDAARGTAGALTLAEPLIEPGDFFVVNGDSYLATDWGKLIEFHRKRRALATLALIEVPDASRYATVGIDTEGRIQTFAEKSCQGAGLISSGVYLLNSRLLAEIKSKDTSLEYDVFPRLIGRGLLGLRCQGYFIDIGTPESYRQLQSDPSGFLASLYGRGER